ncbi:MAG: CBS domain-containing protein [Clostridiales Family XIII bacterium]|jgi:CBS domain-containing protein|nr:CBS domain-containing protein [Clostridiales Family XIII bacterium]
MAKIHEIMETTPYTCRATDTVRDVILSLSDVQVGSLIIVDGNMGLLGYISDSDIIKQISHKKGHIFDWGDMAPIIMDGESLEDRINDLLNTPVIEIATKKMVFVTPQQEITEALELIKEERIKKLAVIEDGKVVGVIGRSAIIRHILSRIVPGENDGEE